MYQIYTEKIHVYIFVLSNTDLIYWIITNIGQSNAYT